MGENVRVSKKDQHFEVGAQNLRTDAATQIGYRIIEPIQMALLSPSYKQLNEYEQEKYRDG